MVEKAGFTFEFVELPWTRALKDLALHPFTLSQEDVFFGVSKKLDQDKFNKLMSAFKDLERDGSLQKIRDKY